MIKAFASTVSARYSLAGYSLSYQSSLGFVRLVLLLIVLSTLLFSAGVLLAYKGLQWYWRGSNTIYFPKQQVITIESTDSVRSVMSAINQYADKQDPLIDRSVLKFIAPEVVVKVGEYELEGYYSRAELFALFEAGKSKQYPLTLIEGETAKEFIFKIKNNPLYNTQTPSDDLSTHELIYGLLDSRAKVMMGEQTTIEGWLLPETYFFDRGTDLSQIIKRVHKDMLDVLLSEWALRNKSVPLQTPYEALILASIIEKESGHVDEREQIAGVFIRRLQKGMRLQTDPTVIYGMGDKYKGDLRRKDLKQDTPYNTYTRHGLPPTPIAMPGVASIRAAMHPADGKALYFVAKGDGSHYFSETLEEHNKAVRKYQILFRRADYQSKPQ